MNKPRIQDAVQWIALNDNPFGDASGNPDAEANVAGYISTLLVADLFGLDPKAVARRVMQIRRDRINAALRTAGLQAMRQRGEL